jgi:O-antigen ligase/polysaccharide polymerase Wzy-like membrane protein
LQDGAVTAVAAQDPSLLYGRMLRGLFALLLTFAIFLPFIPIAGPFSADDLLPLAGVGLGIAALLFDDEPPRADATLIGFSLLALFSVISSTVNAESSTEFGRLLGRSLGRTIFYLAVVLTTRGMLPTRRLQHAAVWLFVIAATLESLFAIWAVSARYYGPYGLGVADFGAWSVLKGGVRAQGTFSGALTANETAVGSANFLAAYLVMSVPVTVGLSLQLGQKPRLQMIVVAAALVQTVALYLTYTRAALAALGVTILVLGFLIDHKRLAIGVLVAALALTFAIPSMRAKILDEGNDRKALYWASIKITREHAVTGIGDGTYETLLLSNREYFNTPYGSAETTSHNSILLAAANHGIAGGVAQLLIYVLLAAVALRSVKSAALEDRFVAAGVAAALAGYLAQDQLNNLAYVPKVATQMWFLFGVLTAVGGLTTARTDNRRAAES